MTLAPLQDVKLDTISIYGQQQLNASLLRVFKLVATFYISIQQRAADKNVLPTVVQYLKSFINCTYECAEWFLSEFINLEVLRECLLEC